MQSKNAAYLQVYQLLLNAQKDLDLLKKENYGLVIEKETYKYVVRSLEF
jgi:hypothetical protein